ncbi:MAG: Holliday junction branch migration protein RuvA [Candidatus Margulisbacteria bacterium]|jgi:Holliday junction DNA helicase RuvA|nr:Holliday junction branch migration protein RuvA [Candidatus Margulisiibacteriota bacterium]
MIAYLQGKILAKDEQSVILETGGVGYQICLSARALKELPGKREQAFYIYQHIREDARLLYGFADWPTRQVFLTLLGVPGVGPKMALSILDRHAAAEAVNIIYRGDAGSLGAGKKTAEKIIVELKDKIARLFPELIRDKNISPLSAADSLLEEGFLADLRSALGALGYTPKESELLVRKHISALAGLNSTEEAVTYLLKHL